MKPRWLYVWHICMSLEWTLWHWPDQRQYMYGRWICYYDCPAGVTASTAVFLPFPSPPSPCFPHPLLLNLSAADGRAARTTAVWAGNENIRRGATDAPVKLVFSTVERRARHAETQTHRRTHADVTKSNDKRTSCRYHAFRAFIVYSTLYTAQHRLLLPSVQPTMFFCLDSICL